MIIRKLLPSLAQGQYHAVAVPPTACAIIADGACDSCMPHPLLFKTPGRWLHPTSICIASKMVLSFHFMPPSDAPATPCTSSRRVWAGPGRQPDCHRLHVPMALTSLRDDWPPGAYACHVSKGSDQILFVGFAISSSLLACIAGLDMQAPFFGVG